MQKACQCLALLSTAWQCLALLSTSGLVSGGARGAMAPPLTRPLVLSKAKHCQAVLSKAKHWHAFCMKKHWHALYMKFSKENLVKQSKSFSLHFKSLVKSASILSLVF